MNTECVSPVTALSPAWYTDPRVFDAEQRLIFAREWTVAGPASQLLQRGNWISLVIAGQPVIIVRGDDNALHGHINICRHRAGSILDPDSVSGRCAALSCPYHGWVYALDGTLSAAPGFDSAPGFDAGAHALVPVRVDEWNGIVFACLDPDAPALVDWLGDVVTVAADFPSISSLTFDHVISNDALTDWKAYSDNSAEAYHLEYVHPALSKAVAPGSDIRAFENGRYVGFDVRYQNGAGDITGRGYWIYKFPGVLLHFSTHGFNMERVIPTAPGRSRLQRWFWSTPDADQASRQRAIDASSDVMGEDLRICENVQRNLESGGAHRGLLSPQREPGTIYFQQLVREALAREPLLPPP